MIKLVDLKKGDTIYCLNKENLNINKLIIFDNSFNIIFENNLICELYIETEYGIKKCNITKQDEYCSNFFFIDNNIRHNYYISTSLYSLIDNYKKLLIQSRKYYENIINDLNSKLEKNKKYLDKTIDDILNIERINYDNLEDR